jgi:hypothetical protein
MRVISLHRLPVDAYAPHRSSAELAIIAKQQKVLAELRRDLVAVNATIKANPAHANYAGLVQGRSDLHERIREIAQEVA